MLWTDTLLSSSLSVDLFVLLFLPHQKVVGAASSTQLFPLVVTMIGGSVVLSSVDDGVDRR
jgi:hypothetical protein